MYFCIHFLACLNEMFGCQICEQVTSYKRILQEVCGYVWFGTLYLYVAEYEYLLCDWQDGCIPEYVGENVHEKYFHDHTLLHM